MLHIEYKCIDFNQIQHIEFSNVFEHFTIYILVCLCVWHMCAIAHEAKEAVDFSSTGVTLSCEQEEQEGLLVAEPVQNVQNVC